MLQRAIYPVTIVVVLGVTAFLLFFRPTDQRRVESLVNRQVSMWNSGDIRGLYDTLSPQARTRCSWNSFAALAQRGKQALGSYGGSPQVGVSDVQVSVTGQTAEVQLSVVVGPVQLYRVAAGSPLTYTKVGGTWYLDSAGPLESGCSAG